MSISDLEALFPAPSLPPSSLSPHVWPGNSPESTATLQKCLKENHDKFHIFFNDSGFHNHTSHHLLAIWALGANGSLIEAAYEINAEYQRLATDSPEAITSDNLWDHLGDPKYWKAYLAFFSKVVLDKGAEAALGEYIFSPKANYDSARELEGKKQPEMLSRFVSSLLHPLIHTGYGVEFGLRGMVAEGLAQTAVTDATNNVLIRPSLFDPTKAGMSGLASLVPSVVLNTIYPPSQPLPHARGAHAFTILSRILSDPEMSVKNPNRIEAMFAHTLETRAERIRWYAEQWTVDIERQGELEDKIEELVWTNVLLYGIGGWAKDRPFKASFFIMHLVTSSLFLHSLTAFCKPASQVLLLRAYFVTSLTWWLSRGRPPLKIAEFFDSTSPHPKPPVDPPKSTEGTLPSRSSPFASTPNPWLPIIQSALVHPGEHLCKIQRALAHFSVLYAGRSGRDFIRKGAELEGVERLDGTLFIRVAGLTADRLGWMREGENQGKWDREGFWECESLKPAGLTSDILAKLTTPSQ